MRNSPRIAVFIGKESQQYCVLIEQSVLCQVPFAFFGNVQCILCISCGVSKANEECPSFFFKTMSCHFPMDYVGLLLTL